MKKLYFKDVLKMATDKGYVPMLPVWAELTKTERGDFRKYERIEAVAMYAWLIVKHKLPLQKEADVQALKWVDTETLANLRRAISKVQTVKNDGNIQDA